MSRSLLLCLFVFLIAPHLARPADIDPSVRKSIQAGNLAWVKGMEAADAAVIAATYQDDALDCGPSGSCEQGRAAIFEHFRKRIDVLGRASSAEVTSAGAVQQGEYVYEWGTAKATFSSGRKIQGRYLTVWHIQPDGTWKIFRNMSIPEDRHK